MASLWKRIEHGHVKPALRRLRPYQTVSYAGVTVSYKRHLDGGGSTFGQEFIPVLRARGMPKQKRAYEWCSGPGFIGDLDEIAFYAAPLSAERVAAHYRAAGRP